MLKTRVMSHIQKTITLVFVLIMACLLGCGEPQPLKIGFVGQLSGRQSELGVSARNAIQLEIDQINDSGGVKGRLLELVARDNEGSDTKCREVLNEMMAEDIQFFLGPMMSKMAKATLETIDGRNVLLISPTISTEYASGKDDNFLRIIPSVIEQSKELAQFTIDSGIKSVAVVYGLTNRTFTEALYTSFKTAFEEKGGRITLALPMDNTKKMEVLPLARKVVATQPDAVLTCLSGIDAANLGQQLRKLGSSAQLLGVGWSQTEDLIRHGGRAVEGMILISSGVYGVGSPALMTFTENYQSRYKTPPSFGSRHGYDAMGMLLAGMNAAETLTPASVKKALLEIKSYEGLNGSISLNEFGDFPGHYTMVEVKNGTFVSLE